MASALGRAGRLAAAPALTANWRRTRRSRRPSGPRRSTPWRGSRGRPALDGAVRWSSTTPRPPPELVARALPALGATGVLPAERPRRLPRPRPTAVRVAALLGPDRRRRSCRPTSPRRSSPGSTTATRTSARPPSRPSARLRLREAVPDLIAGRDGRLPDRGRPSALCRPARPAGRRRLPRRHRRPQPRPPPRGRVGPAGDPRSGAGRSGSGGAEQASSTGPAAAAVERVLDPVPADRRLEGDRPVRADDGRGLRRRAARSTSPGSTRASRAGRSPGPPAEAEPGDRPGRHRRLQGRRGRQGRVRLRHQRLARPRRLRLSPRSPPTATAPALLLVGSSGSVLVTLNERGRPQLLRTSPAARYAPDTDLVRVDLKGTNRLLVRVPAGDRRLVVRRPGLRPVDRGLSPGRRGSTASPPSATSPLEPRRRRRRAARRSSSTPRGSAA